MTDYISHRDRLATWSIDTLGNCVTLLDGAYAERHHGGLYKRLTTTRIPEFSLGSTPGYKPPGRKAGDLFSSYS